VKTFPVRVRVKLGVRDRITVRGFEVRVRSILFICTTVIENLNVQ